jgi:hypothetical protein
MAYDKKWVEMPLTTAGCKQGSVSLSPRNDTTQIKENKTVTKLHELKPFAPLP